jgi:transcriptional regulator|nr:MAG TPA: hypothetical protein [Caudoviricetes sp.]
MENKKIALNIYKTIKLALINNQMSQRKLCDKIKMKPQTFSDNMTKLKKGQFPKVELLLQIQKELKINLMINFFEQNIRL